MITNFYPIRLNLISIQKKNYFHFNRRINIHTSKILFTNYEPFKNNQRMFLFYQFIMLHFIL